MIATIVQVTVKPDCVTRFIEATAENHKNSIQEPGNLRFDVLQNTEDPVRFVLYEAYETETAADWMAEPRSGINHTLLYPREEE